MPFSAPSAGSRKVEPRKRKQSPSDRRRKAKRALVVARNTASEIQGAARRRQRERSSGAANAAAVLDTDLGFLYDRFGDEKREIFVSGVFIETPYKGRTWRAE